MCRFMSMLEQLRVDGEQTGQGANSTTSSLRADAVASSLVGEENSGGGGDGDGNDKKDQ